MSVLKLLFGNLFSKKPLVKTIMDSKLGKLVCQYKPDNVYFTWDTEYKIKINNEEPISICIDGDLNGPFSNVLQKTYQIIDSLSELSYEVQNQIDVEFSERKINLTRDYSFKDIFVHINEETNKVDFELEYYSNDAEIMISVEFINDKIDVIEFY